MSIVWLVYSLTPFFVFATLYSSFKGGAIVSVSCTGPEQLRKKLEAKLAAEHAANVQRLVSEIEQTFERGTSDSSNVIHFLPTDRAKRYAMAVINDVIALYKRPEVGWYEVVWSEPSRSSHWHNDGDDFVEPSPTLTFFATLEDYRMMEDLRERDRERMAEIDEEESDRHVGSDMEFEDDLFERYP